MSSLSQFVTVCLGICLIINHMGSLAQPVEDPASRLKRTPSDWFYDIFSDYFYGTDSEEYLICRNCTVHVNGQGQNNGATAVSPPPTVAPTPAPTVAPSSSAPPAAAGPPATPAPGTTAAPAAAASPAAGAPAAATPPPTATA